MKIIFDTCVILDLLKKGLSVDPLWAMDFQKSELDNGTKKELMHLLNFLPPLENQALKHKDQNFFLLDPVKFKIFTYDKELKKKLLRYKYQIIESVSQYERSLRPLTY